MKIRTKLALRFTIIVASLLIIFAIAIYYFSSSYRKKEFYERLDEKALNYAKLITEVDEFSPGMTKIFDRNTAYLKNERILIYNDNNKQIFNTNDDVINIPVNHLESVRQEKEIRYLTGNNETLAKIYPHKKGIYVAIVSAFDEEGFKKLNNLKIILLTGLLICVVVTMIAGWIYSGHALAPISGIVRQVSSISASNLEERINEGKGRDEISLLAITFNNMLERIKNSFELQRGFVANSSHELRTPLTSITGQLEVALMSERSSSDYKTLLKSILEDIRRVNRLTNGLLELAQADMDLSKLKMKKVRLDELLWVTRNDFLKRNANYSINIVIENFPEDENELIVYGSEHLLRSALINIFENGCKFSDDRSVSVVFKSQNETIDILIKDSGIGISGEDIQKIYQPFFRGANAKEFPGHGLGLSLTSKIITLHRAKMTIVSEINKYTEINLKFPVYYNDN